MKAQVLAGGRGKGHFIGGKMDIGGVFVTKKFASHVIVLFESKNGAWDEFERLITPIFL